MLFWSGLRTKLLWILHSCSANAIIPFTVALEQNHGSVRWSITQYGSDLLRIEVPQDVPCTFIVIDFVLHTKQCKPGAKNAKPLHSPAEGQGHDSRTLLLGQGHWSYGCSDCCILNSLWTSVHFPYLSCGFHLFVCHPITNKRQLGAFPWCH